MNNTPEEKAAADGFTSETPQDVEVTFDGVFVEGDDANTGAGFPETLAEQQLHEVLAPQIEKFENSDLDGDDPDALYAPQPVDSNIDRVTEEVGLGLVSNATEVKPAVELGQKPKEDDEQDPAERDGVSPTVGDGAAGEDGNEGAGSANSDPSDEPAAATSEDNGEAPNYADQFGIDPDVFTSLPEAAQTAIQSAGESAAKYQRLEEAMAPFAQQLEGIGGSTIEGVETLANLSAFANRDPAAYGAWFVQNVADPSQQQRLLEDISAALGLKITTQAASSDGNPSDPDDLFADDSDDDQNQQAQNQQAQQPIDVNQRMRQAQADNLIQTFTSIKNGDGELAHPMLKADHSMFAACQTAMTAAIKQDMATGAITGPPKNVAEMRKYYLRAEAFLDPSSASSAAQAQQANATKDQRTAAAAKAKRASSPVGQGRQAAPAQTPAADMSNPTNKLAGVDVSDLNALLEAQMAGMNFQS